MKPEKQTVRQWALWGTAALSALSVLLCVGRLPLQEAAVVHELPRTAAILIDAGHGGQDGGAAAPDGTLEKTLNLDISLKLADFLRLFGYTVRMTRTEDVSLHAPDAQTIREKKVSDMHTRLQLYDAADLVLSIHQNKFGQSRYHGAMVMYSPRHPAAQQAASTVRETLYALLQPDNTRELKRGDDSVFLLYKTVSPAVLIECGFLSNPDECALLKEEDYRRKLAFAVTCGVLRYAP